MLICLHESDFILIGIKQLWLIVKAEGVHEMGCGAWTLSSAMATGALCSEGFRQVSTDVAGGMTWLFLPAVCMCTEFLFQEYSFVISLFKKCKMCVREKRSEDECM